MRTTTSYTSGHVRPSTLRRSIVCVYEEADPQISVLLYLLIYLSYYLTCTRAMVGSDTNSSYTSTEGEIAVRSWLGAPADPVNAYRGVGWILASDWLPYQRPSFVTPPFPGFISGHSTFSRAAAEVMTAITGSRFFPGGRLRGSSYLPQLSTASGLTS